MKNIDLSERLSKKNTIVAIICIVVFLIAGFLAAVLGHIAYVNSREAEILNYSHSSSSDFFMRSDGLNLVYKYKDSVSEVNLSNILELSDGASFRILVVLNEDGEKISHSEVTFDVSDKQQYFVIVNVTSLGRVHTNGYLIEIVSETDYSEVPPEFDISDYFQQYISAE